MDSGYAPILIFTYKRLSTLQRTIESLKKNIDYFEHDIHLFSDGPKVPEDIERVNEVRLFIKSIVGFKSIYMHESKENKGLANSIIDGVTDVINKYNAVIVLEDDLILSDNFLTFMNQALNYYKDNPKVVSISGYNMGVKVKHTSNYSYDIFFAMRSASWGWATWKDKWDNIDWSVNDYEEFAADKNAIRKFNETGSDMFHLLKRQKTGRSNSWAIRYNYHQFKYDLYSVFPIKSKVNNIGFGADATHTVQKYNRFGVELDNTSQKHFIFTNHLFFDENIMSNFRSINSLKNRLLFKIINFMTSKL